MYLYFDGLTRINNPVEITVCTINYIAHITLSEDSTVIQTQEGISTYN